MSNFDSYLNPKLNANFKFLVVALFVFFVAGCAELNLIKSDAAKGEPRAGEPEKKSPPKMPAAKAPPVAIHYPDPMADKVIPLSLVKGYDQVNHLVKKKATSSAMQLLHQLQQAHSRHSGPSYKMAGLYYRQSSFDKALAAIEKSLAIDSKNYHAHNLHGILLRSAGKFQQAKAAYLKAIALYPGFSKGHLNLAILADIYLYDLGLALKHYQQYQLIAGDKERKVAGWIIDLKRRMAKEG